MRLLKLDNGDYINPKAIEALTKPKSDPLRGFVIAFKSGLRIRITGQSRDEVAELIERHTS